MDAFDGSTARLPTDVSCAVNTRVHVAPPSILLRTPSVVAYAMDGVACAKARYDPAGETFVHVAPLSVLRQSPPPAVLLAAVASSVLGVAGLIARSKTVVPAPSVSLATAQCAPPSVVFSTPVSNVPWYTVDGLAGSIAKADDDVVRVFAFVNVFPPSVLLNVGPFSEL